MNNNKIKGFVKNISYSFSANIVSLIISALTVLILPKFVGVETYGYYQLYIFYISYAAVLNFGWNDGIYLRIGGMQYKNLDKKSYSCQYRSLMALEFIIYTAICLCILVSNTDPRQKLTLVCVCIFAVMINPRWILVYILQATNKIREYSIVAIIDRVLFVIITFVFVITNHLSIGYLLFADLFARGIATGITIYCCRDIVFAKPTKFKYVIPEIKKNIIAGFKLMLASLSSMLIIGVIRFGIQNHWDISTFGKVSLTLSISNMIVQAINAIAVVLYPMLRRTDDEKLPKLYNIMRVVLAGLVFGFLIFYYPMQKILVMWLPQYAQSLRYAAILFPVCAYESKMSMLINTYYKTLRMEKILMYCNIISLCVSVLCTIIATLVLNSVTFAIISILISLIVKCVLSEIILSRHIDIHVYKDIILEIIMTAAFVICNWFFGFIGMISYAVCYILYLILKKNDIRQTFEFIKTMK